MPILQFYTNTNQLTLAEKEELVKTLTAFYAKHMPDFFVNIVFNEVRPRHRVLSHNLLSLTHVQLPQGSFFVGGKPTDGKFVRFTADHIAVNFKKDTRRERLYLDWLGGVFKERFEPKGWTYVLTSLGPMRMGANVIWIVGNSTLRRVIEIYGGFKA